MSFRFWKETWRWGVTRGGNTYLLDLGRLRIYIQVTGLHRALFHASIREGNICGGCPCHPGHKEE